MQWMGWQCIMLRVERLRVTLGSLRQPARFITAIAVLYAALTTIFYGLRFEPIGILLLCIVLQVLGKRIKDLFERLVPYLLFVIAYDAVRYGRDAWLTRERVTVCGIRSLEQKLLSFGSGSTPGDWAQRHANVALDLLFAAPYFVFAYVVLGYGLVLYFVDRPRMSRFLWAFLVANLIAFVIWLAYPVAPPWYQRAHGCVVDLAVRPSPAGLARVDALLQIPYFQTFYGKSTYVFGAMPSLHCTYPMVGLLTAWRHVSWKTRPLHIAYVSLMFCASVYLDHHYVLDGLAGFCLAGLSVWVVTQWSTSRFARQALPGVAT
jgi:inositol phosphorylceramide synthase catalytic subunit